MRKIFDINIKPNGTFSWHMTWFIISFIEINSS